MPISAAGSPSRPRRHGFTLLELLVVLAIVAFVSAAVGFAMRDATQSRLEREGLRLAALLEAGRSRSQVSGVAVRWRVLEQGFRFEGLASAEPGKDELPQGWLDADTVAAVMPPPPSTAQTAQPNAADTLLLGPEPIIPAQSLRLSSRANPDRQIRLGTDGLRPFALQLEVAP